MTDEHNEGPRESLSEQEAVQALTEMEAGHSGQHASRLVRT
jgi:hypothetical protein